jgi:hypothetical protein
MEAVATARKNVRGVGYRAEKPVENPGRSTWIESSSHGTMRRNTMPVPAGR